MRMIYTMQISPSHLGLNTTNHGFFFRGSYKLFLEDATIIVFHIFLSQSFRLTTHNTNPHLDKLYFFCRNHAVKYKSVISIRMFSVSIENGRAQ